MATEKDYTLVYTASFQRHVKLVPAKYHSLIRETLKEQLEYQAEVKTRNRKPLAKPVAFKAEWELRFGPGNRFRVFYKVEGNDVVLLALGEKRGNRLWIEGKRGQDMNKATLDDVQASLEKYVRRSAKQPVLILREGEPVAMLVGINARKRPTIKLRDVLKRAWKEYEEQGGIGHDQFWEELSEEVG